MSHPGATIADVIAWIVLAALTVLSLGLLSRKGNDRLRVLLLVILLVSPAAFSEGVRDWITDQMPDLPTMTTTTTTVVPTPPPTVSG